MLQFPIFTCSIFCIQQIWSCTSLYFAEREEATVYAINTEIITNINLQVAQITIH